MQNYGFWVVRLLFIAFLLDSDMILMYDMRHKFPTEVGAAAPLSRNVKETFKINMASSGENFYFDSLPKRNSVRRQKLRADISSLSHNKNILRFIENESIDHKWTNIKSVPKTSNRMRMRNTLHQSSLVEARNEKKGKYTLSKSFNVSLYIRTLSAELARNCTYRTDSGIIKSIHPSKEKLRSKCRTKDNNKDRVKNIAADLSSLPGYYFDTPSEETIELSDQSVELLPSTTVNCMEIHESCLKPSDATDMIQRKKCSCEADCKNYGYCCVDYDFGSVTIETLPEVPFTCIKARKHSGYFAVSKCPSHWDNAYVRDLCENINHRDDMLLSVPVSSKETNFTYRNVYCAYCNDDTNAEFWSLKTPCVNNFNSVNNDMGLMSCFNTSSGLCCTDTINNIGLVKCSDKSSGRCLYVSEPKHLHARSNRRLYRCIYGLVNQCSKNWMSQTGNKTAMVTAIKCSLLYAPVSLYGIVSSNHTIYKNEYCAVCNGVKDIHLMCPVTKGPPGTDTLPRGPSMSVLLDMDFTRGGIIVGSQKRCPSMHIFDPWKEECRNIACKPHFDLQLGHCVPQNAYSNDLPQHQDPLNESSPCLQIILAIEEVLIFENETLVIKSDGSALLPGEYEITNNSTVAICIPGGLRSQYVSTFSELQGYLTTIGMSVSVIFLFVKIVLSVCFPERHKLPPKIVLFLSITLYCSQMLFIFGIYQNQNRMVCAIIGILMHYGFLSSFFWTNVLAYDIWKTFTSSQIITKTHFAKKRLLYYCLYGWMSPLFIVASAATLDWFTSYELLKPRYGKSVCWISNKAALAAFFGLPLILILMSNTIFFFITSREIRKTTKAAKIAHNTCSGAKNRSRFGLYCKLAFIMGLTWIFGFVAAFSGNSLLWYLFIAFNSIQGVYIFVGFTHFRIPSNLIPKRSSQWTLSGNFAGSRSSTTLTAPIAKL